MRNQVTALPPGAAAAAATHGLYTAWRSPGCSTPRARCSCSTWRPRASWPTPSCCAWMSARRGLYGDIFVFKHLININH
jgi:hypothetical protein